MNTGALVDRDARYDAFRERATQLSFDDVPLTLEEWMKYDRVVYFRFLNQGENSMGKSMTKYPSDPNALNVMRLIDKDLMDTSLSEAHRNYLGMSGIGRCPRQQYFDFINGQQSDLRRDKYAKRGYLIEGDAKQRLARIGFYVPGSEVSLVAPFDKRFCGHTDGATKDGCLLELKSVGEKGFDEVLQFDRPKIDHLAQVQTYMRYGKWTTTLIIYIQADTFDHYPLFVAKDDRIGDAMEAKAKNILKAIDSHTPPQCECGWCKH